MTALMICIHVYLIGLSAVLLTFTLRITWLWYAESRNITLQDIVFTPVTGFTWPIVALMGLWYLLDGSVDEHLNKIIIRSKK